MLVVSVCLLENTNLIEEHVSSKRDFPSYIKKGSIHVYVGFIFIFFLLLLNKGAANHK